MQRITPIEPFNPDPDARYLREASRPGPIDEPRRLGALWLIAALLVLVISACSQAGAAQEPSASPTDLKRAAAGAKACPRGHAAIWSSPSSMECLREL